MIETPQIIQTSEILSAVIRLNIPREEIRNVMGPALEELYSTIAAQRIELAGPWFTHHLRMIPDRFDFEVCIAISTPVTASGRVEPGICPAMKVARTVYHGSFEGLGSAWGEFDDWIAANGHPSATDLWERYLVGPDSSPEPADWRTELNRPLMG